MGEGDLEAFNLTAEMVLKLLPAICGIGKPSVEQRCSVNLRRSDRAVVVIPPHYGVVVRSRGVSEYIYIYIYIHIYI
jgi:hypothetical protein